MKKTIYDVHAVADAVSIPCLFYNVPAMTGQALSLEELLGVLLHENIIALKDSSGNSLLAQAITNEKYRPEGVTLFDGDEYRTVFSAMTGYDGVIYGGGVMTAKIVKNIWSSVKAGDMQTAITLDNDKSLCLGEIYNRFSSPLQNIAGQKYAIKLLGGFAIIRER